MPASHGPADRHPSLPAQRDRCGADASTVNRADLTLPPGVFTRIGPLVAAAGTVASISVGDTTL